MLAEWDFIQSLPYHAQTEQDAEFIRMMYTVRLKKVRRAQFVQQRAYAYRHDSRSSRTATT